MICSAVRTGTPFSSKVASVRENWANKFSFTDFAKDRRGHFPLVQFAPAFFRGFKPREQDDHGDDHKDEQPPEMGEHVTN